MYTHSLDKTRLELVRQQQQAVRKQSLHKYKDGGNDTRRQQHQITLTRRTVLSDIKTYDDIKHMIFNASIL